MKNKWELIVAAVAGLVLLGCLALAFLTFRGNPDPLPTVGGAQEMPPSAVPVIQSAAQTLQEKVQWTSPVLAGGSSLDLFVSRPVLVPIENPDPANPIEMDNPASQMLHPPVPNAFFLEYDLPYLQANVLEQDQDEDGFSNLEEYQGDTDPTDASEHPPVTAKLALEEIKTSSRFFEYNFEGGGRVRIQGGNMRGSRFRGDWGEYAELGGTVGPSGQEDRYELVDHQSGRQGSVTLRDTSRPEDARNATFSLPYREPTAITDYTAVFLFTLNRPSGERIEVPERGSFTLPDNEEMQFRLQSVDEDANTAVIEQLDPSGEVIDELTIGEDGPR